MTKDKNHQQLIKLRADIRARDKVIGEMAVRNSQLETALDAMELLAKLRGEAITELKKEMEK